VNSNESKGPLFDGVAIIGMAGRFPGARSVAEFWRNQLDGVEAISQFSIEDLEIPDAARIAQDSSYVRARSILDDVDLFDAEFFGIYPREAELMDPQQRLFLESCWVAFEDAGYDPFTFPGAVGVYAGSSTSTYFLSRLCTNPGFIDRFTGGYQVGNYPEMMGNNLDFLSTRVSYKFNLRGPSFTMQAGCSTSLLAVTQACQSLLTYQSDMALAGGTSITFPQKRGSYYQDGGMVSPDGHCRTFDADAQGTVFGSGVAVVLLKRLEDAVRDGDQIYAVIRGFAANNDGSAKVGYTAPSVEGQARVIALAQEAAGVNPETVGYIEAHGTGTPLGDPIELTALTQAFRAHTVGKQFCAIGTAKTNVGHLDIAAGVTGLIHASHVVRHGVFPPTLHFRKPNPQFDLENSPFYVNSGKTDWKSGKTPRRAGVSAFGVGGTNAHIVLEQAPERISEPSKRPAQLLVLSARTESALNSATANLAEYFRSHSDLNLADAAWTLQTGRRAFSCRHAVVARDTTEAIAALTQPNRKGSQTRLRTKENPEIHFLFPGQGSQHANMAREIYESEPVFREAVDRCAKILLPHLELDLRTLLYPPQGTSEEAQRRVTDTIIAQPAIFTVEYALAQLWMSWGIRPAAMLGHSIGEFVAACLAGVFSLEDALALVATRGKMMQAVPPGGMLSVRLPESEVRSRINGSGHLSVAAVNSPSLCVVAGPFEALEKLELDFGREGIACRRLVTSHAFHSAMMDPLIDPFTARVAQVNLRRAQIPYISGVTGTWITDSEATDPAYWARHFRQAVQFSAGVTELRKNSNAILLEVGPGNVLSTLSRQHTGTSSEQMIATSLPGADSGESDAAALLTALGAVWLAGAQPNWASLHGEQHRQRISLPTYPFERKRFWLESAAPELSAVQHIDSPVDRTSDVQVQPTATEPSIMEETKPVNVITQPPAAAVNAPSRATKIRTILAEIFEELSGTQISQADAATTFLELGFDSLFLTQVTQSLHNKFGLKVTFRQLLGDQSTLDSLADYIDAKLPANILAESAPVAARPQAVPSTDMPSITPDPATAQAVNKDAVSGETPIERLLREQRQAMNDLFAKQLDAVRSAPGMSASAPTSSHIAGASTVTTSPAASSVPLPSSVNNAVAHSPSNAKVEKEEFKPFGPYKPPQKGASGDLTDRQKKGLQRLVDKYTKRTAKSKAMTQEYRKPLADPRVVSGFRALWKEMVYPITTVRSKDSRLWDLDDNEYIDILNGFGPIMLGHRPDFVEQAIEKQLHQGFEIGPQTPLACEVAKMFCDMTGNERMTFCNTGSEAVTAALRVARTVTGRNKVVLFAGAYHGMFDEVLVKGFKKGGVPQSAPVAPGIPREKVANVIVLDYGTPESLEWIRQNANDLAAVLVEPVQSRHPHLQPREFLHEIRKITQDSGAALIFDEVVTGFRVHQGGCQALFGIRADLATYGKVLAGGMPIGVLAGKAAFMDALDGGQWQYGDDSFPEVGVTFFAGTFVRHPLTLAAVKAVLQHFKTQGPALQEQLTERTTGMVRRINEFMEQNAVPTRLESFGSIFYFAFPAEERFASLFYYFLRAKGIHVLEGFPCFLTTTHSEADIEQIIHIFKESVAEMQQAGFFPTPSGTSDTLANPSSIVSAPASTEPVESPVTESQLEVWLSDQLGEEASCSYNESFTLHMRGTANETALKESLRELVSRHQALRASFGSEGEIQRFAPNLRLEIPTVALTQLSAEQRESQLKQIIENDAHTPFHLADGPLVRAQIVKLEPNHQLLIFTAHHIVCDGWSTNVLLDELSKLYNARNRGVACDLPAPMSFAAYAKSQSEFLNGPEGEKVEKYWLEQFEKPAPLLDLPTDRPRPSIKEFKGATLRRKIGAASYNSIKKLGAKQKCTLFVTLVAGFQILLSRLSGQDDIVVGIPTAGQSLIEDQILVGHCVNFIPLRAQTTDNPTTSQFLSQVRQTVLASYENQNYTYGRLVRKLTLQRDPSRLPLTEVQFNLERVGDGMNFDGFEAEVDPNPKSFVNFDIFLNIVESKDGLTLDCDYNTGLFDEETIARWLGHYETLLEGMVADVDQPVSRLPLLNDAESRRQLLHWNDTNVSFPRDLSVHKLFERQAKQTPDITAVVFEDQQLTYTELDRRANQLAQHLRRLGVKPGTRVGVFVERSLEMIVALLGVLKSGAAYVPMDPTFPPERLRYVLEDAKTPVVLTQKPLTKNWSFGEAYVVHLDTDWDLIAQEATSKPEEVITPEDPAYVIYTSGSTGRPKGVQVPHRAVANLLQAMLLRPGLEKSDTLAAVTTLSFDIAGLELYLPLCVGAKLVIVSRETGSYGVQLLDYLKKVNATVMQATPVTWQLLIEAGWNGSPALKALCGGEAFPRELANELVKLSKSVWNMYGPTETTIWSATGQVKSGNGPVPIGQPIANTQFYILDKELQLVPPGVPGELHIAGDGLATGYLNRKELTAEKFIPNPFRKEPSARMYKTGDLVRRCNDGSIEFLGRLDDQIKLRGFRIELGEIQTVLSSYPGIGQAIVILREDVPGEKRLVAYLVLAKDATPPPASDLRNFLLTKLPDYMVPAAFAVLESFPLTPNGKIDRRALPAPNWSKQSRGTPFAAPRTPEEQKMAGIWAEVLHLERVGINDNLFELGADSLHVFQIAARANKADIAVTPRQILQYRTIAAIFGELAKTGNVKPAASVITPVERQKYRVNREAPQQVETKG
jgi:amino acid adenylation domain-containing protein